MRRFWRRLDRVLRTSSMRLALRYALLQVLLLALAFGVLLSFANRYVAEQLIAGLVSESDVLAALPQEQLILRLHVLSQDTSGMTRDSRHVLLLNAQGVKQAGDMLAWPPGLQENGHVQPVMAQIADGDDPAEHENTPVLARGISLSDGSRFVVAQERGASEDMRDSVFSVAALVLALSGLLSLALGLALGWQWLKRIETIERTAGAIAAGDLSQRVQMRGQGDEFDLLAAHLNTMLARIEVAIKAMREVSDNVAHDLRQPLTRMKARIEVALGQSRDAASYREVLQSTALDADELKRAFDAMLSIARLESGGEILHPEVFDLSVLVASMSELYAAQAEDAGRDFSISLQPGLRVMGEPALVARALANLLDNAFAYTASKVAIVVALESSAQDAVLAVRDGGAGLSDAEKQRFVERFARGDAARSQQGHGLGLTLARAVAHAHGGQLLLEDAPEGGLSVSLRIPLVISV
ncbi:MAG: ATP-binding protein [Halothiobacillaceae bacterium]|nr:ATP-binding protein [Halothiobacillaceae bacterium]